MALPYILHAQTKIVCGDFVSLYQVLNRTIGSAALPYPKHGCGALVRQRFGEMGKKVHLERCTANVWY